MNRSRTGLLLLLALSFVHHDIFGRPGEVVTRDGRRLVGDITSPFGVLEWRRDIAVADGQPFFIKPERKGRVALADIREIRRLPPGTTAAEVVELEDGRQARILIQYRIILNSGRRLDISDFITLENYYVEVASGEETARRVYLTTISGLVFRERTAPVSSAPRRPSPLPSGVAASSPQPPQANLSPPSPPPPSPSLPEPQPAVPPPSTVTASDEVEIPRPPKPLIPWRSPWFWLSLSAAAALLLSLWVRSPFGSESLFALFGVRKRRKQAKRRSRRRP